MNKYLALLLFLASSLIIHSQELCGKYFNGDYYIDFDNGYAEFVTLSDGCLASEISGQGKFEIIDDYLLIFTELHSSPNSKYTAIKNNTDYSSITVVLDGGYSVPNAKIKFLDSNKLVIGETETDFRQGKAIIKSTLDIKFIHVSYIGTNSVIIDFDRTMDYKIVLGESMSIENETVVFKMSDKTEKSITLTLLSIAVKTKRKIAKDLGKLESNVIKNKPKEWVFRK